MNCRKHDLDPCPVCDGCGAEGHRPGVTVCLDCPTDPLVSEPNGSVWVRVPGKRHAVRLATTNQTRTLDHD